MLGFQDNTYCSSPWDEVAITEETPQLKLCIRKAFRERESNITSHSVSLSFFPNAVPSHRTVVLPTVPSISLSNQKTFSKNGARHHRRIRVLRLAPVETPLCPTPGLRRSCFTRCSSPSHPSRRCSRCTSHQQNTQEHI